MYSGALINRFYTPGITVSEGKAVITMDVRPVFFHAAHAVHGAVYFKMLDDAAFFAANSLVSDVFVLTVNFNVVFLRPVTEGKLVATGAVVHKSRSGVVADAQLADEQGRSIARGSGTFALSKIPLNADVGYE